MALKGFRQLKVYSMSGYNYKDIPTIVLKGGYNYCVDVVIWANNHFPGKI